MARGARWEGPALSAGERMRTFITVHQGSAPRAAMPVLATEDPEVVRATLDAVALRLGVHLGAEPTTPRIGLVRDIPPRPREAEAHVEPPSTADNDPSNVGAFASRAICARPRCGRVFAPRHGGKPNRYCSRDCRRAAWEEAHPRITRTELDRLRAAAIPALMEPSDAGPG